MRSFLGARGLMALVAAVLASSGTLTAASEVDEFVRLARVGDAKAVSDLIDQGRNPDVLGSQGETALGWATFNGHQEVVRILVEGGANVNQRNRFGNPPVLYAAAKGHAEILEILIARGADSSVRGRGDVTPLIAAARDGHSDAVRILLRTDQGSKAGRNVALQAAKRRGHKIVVEILLGFVGVSRD